MGKAAFVRARIDEKLRDDAAAVLAEMGLTVSDVIRITLTRVAKEGTLPFELRVPNAETLAAMAEARALAKSGPARFPSAEAAFNALDATQKP